MRRHVDLRRDDLQSLLSATPFEAAAACAHALGRGAAYRVHQDTVSRENALRIYLMRGQEIRMSRLDAIGFEEALKELSASPYPHLRVAAISGPYDFVAFLDPDCREVIACLGVGRRRPW